MSRSARVLIAALVAIAASASASAQSQSLGQVAKQEEARRASAKKAAKSFSNDDLGPGAIVSPPAAGGAPAAEACYRSASTGDCLTADQMIAASNAKINHEVTVRKESVWRSSASHIRSLLAKLQDEARVLAVAVADEDRSPAERRSAANMLALKQRSIADQERRWEKLVADAAREQIPREWYEPAPTLSTRTPQ